MKDILGTRVYLIKDLQPIVIGKLRALGFEDVSETSLVDDETHRSFYVEAVETELINLELLSKEYQEELKKLG